MSEKRIFSREVAGWLSDYADLLESEALRRAVYAKCSDDDRALIEANRMNALAKKVGQVSLRLHDAKCVLLGGEGEQ